MGTNRRYAHRVDEQIAARSQQVASAPRVLGLSPVEVDLAANSPRRGQEPIPIDAWVHLAPAPVRLTGVALEWTDTAVHVELVDNDGRRHRVWVWADAVRRAEP